MNCGEARRLWFRQSPPAVTPVERVRALAHIGQCAGCRRFVADMEVFRTTGAVDMSVALPGTPSNCRSASAITTKRLVDRLGASITVHNVLDKKLLASTNAVNNQRLVIVIFLKQRQ